MAFNVSTAKKEILQKLAEQAWTPTDLAEELDKSRNTIYNHLEDLYEQGILSKRQVAAKTRPKTEYSIEDGFVQFIAVLPGKFTEKSLTLTPEKEAVLRVWSLPQDEFHPFVQNYWRNLKSNADIDYQKQIEAVAVYGSVARGEADVDSDIDFLVITADEQTADVVTQTVGSVRIEVGDAAKIGMTEVYSMEKYQDSVAQGSTFLENVRDELHIIYDPESILQNTEQLGKNEQ